jgi:hypothetical protein
MKNLYVDDERDCPKGWDIARSYDEAIRLLSEEHYEYISLDYDLGEWNYQVPRTGITILDWLEEQKKNGKHIPFIYIHTGSKHRRNMELTANRLNRD